MTTRLSFKNDDFICNLECRRCIHIKEDGRRCKNRVCIGSPRCWVHNKQTYGVKTRASTIENGGKGLFATKDFNRGDMICPYNSEKLSRECLEERYPGNTDAPYAITSGRTILDGACNRGIGAMVNTNDNTNGQFIYHDNNIWLVATENIRKGDEIFADYGHFDLSEHKTYRSSRKDNRPC